MMNENYNKKTVESLNRYKNQPMFAFKIMSSTSVHSKIYLIDGNTVAIPSANFTNSGINKQHNTVTISTKPKDCKYFEKIFSEIWDE